MRIDKNKQVCFWRNKKLIFLILVNVLLYFPSFFEPISYGDECIYLALGNGFQKGLAFYRDIHDNKPPLLYLTAALGQGSLPLFRLISLAWNLIHLGLIYKLIQKITKNKLAPFIGGSIFTLLTLIFEGKIANGELFMMMPATLAVYLLFAHPKKNSFWFGGLIGSLFSIGFLFKIPIFFDFIGIIFALYFISLKGITLKEIVGIIKNKRLWGIILGFASPILLTIIYYGSKGAFTPYVRSALLQNIGYLSSWQGSNLGLIIRLLFVACLSLAFFLLRRRISYNGIFFAIWFLFGLFGVLLSARPYPHYFIEIVPSLSVLIALTFDKRKVSNFLLTGGAISLLIFSYLYFHFWWYPLTPYYKNFLSYATKKIDRETYLSYWGEKIRSDYKIAQFINQHTPEQGRTFIWGDGACIYAISKKLPPGRYTVNYHIFDFNGFEETLTAIKEKKPRVIVKLRDEKRIWPELEQLLRENYYLLQYQGISDQLFLLRKTDL